jgi:Phage integrase, N-terminal SAM-like domain
MNPQPVSFPRWKEVLARADFSPQLKSAYTREILTFLKHCKASHAPATNELAKQYLDWREKQSNGPAREALRWFYREGRRASGDPAPGPPTGNSAGPSANAGALGVVPPPPVAVLPEPARHFRAMEPPPAASDLGAEPWEQDLIKAIRERGFLWRTEQTYREWAVRFARYIAPRSPYAAAGEDVAAFLSALAVQGRASPSAQKQALNALVFLMQEALHRDLGQMEFKRAYPRQPVLGRGFG